MGEKKKECEPYVSEPGGGERRTKRRKDKQKVRKSKGAPWSLIQKADLKR